MSTLTITGYIAAGYNLSSKYDTVLISDTGGIGGFGLELAYNATVGNRGVIRADSTDSGIRATAGATIGNTDYGTITGFIGIYASNAPATVSNNGTIKGLGADGYGIFLESGGVVTNGSSRYAGYIYGKQSGVLSQASATVANYGSIHGANLDAIDLADGGRVVNYGTLVGAQSGVAAATLLAGVTNFGFIDAFAGAGVNLSKGGTVINGSAAATITEIYSFSASGVSADAPVTVTNFGLIASAGADGVHLTAGGTVINGATGDTTARIETRPVTSASGSGVYAENAPATIANFGIIISGRNALVASGTADGVDIVAGGVVTNGANGDTTAQIAGHFSGVAANAFARVTNFGTVTGDDTDGVFLAAGGTVVNGSTLDTSAAIESAGSGAGVYVKSGDCAVANFGTISSSGTAGDLQIDRAGIAFAGQGNPATDSVTNGSAQVTGALIHGIISGVYFGRFGTVSNFGTITSFRYGIDGGRRASVTNGSAADTTAVIQSYIGVFLGAGFATNFGTIAGASYGGGGVFLEAGGVTNGSAVDTTALIEGRTGVLVGQYGLNTSVVNFGTIAGTAGTIGAAIEFNDPSDVLVVEADCAFVGAVLGGGGTLDLDSGVGTLAGALGVSGNVTVSGSMAKTSFTNFGAVEIGGAASFTLPGGSIVSGKSFIVVGTATTAGTLTSAGTLTVTGTVAGTGTLRLVGGTASFNGAPSLSIARITQSGGVASFGGAAIIVSHPWMQTGGTITAPAGDKVSFAGAGNAFSGTLSGAGTIAFTGGTDAITGATLSATRLIVSGAAVTLSGAIKLSGALTVTSPDLAIASVGVTLSGGGSLNLTNLATNKIAGASSTATLTNLDKITGAGTISNLVLTNKAGGVINANQTTVLILNTGTATIANAGTLESTSTGGLTITSALANTGTLLVANGTLKAGGAVTGAGVVKIAGGVADFASSFSENVAFTSTAGVLELARSTAYAGSISGFSKTGTTSLDLVDIGFISGTTKATYSGTTTSGVLTVTDGTHTAKIHLTGNYTASAWSLSSDGHGGTKVVDPTAPAIAAPSPQAMVAAMAAFGAKAGEPVHAAGVMALAASTLAAPRVAAA